MRRLEIRFGKRVRKQMTAARKNIKKPRELQKKTDDRASATEACTALAKEAAKARKK